MMWLLCLLLLLLGFQHGFARPEQSPTRTNTCGSCEYEKPFYQAGWWTTGVVDSTASVVAITLVVITSADTTVSTSFIYNFPSDASVPATDAYGYPVFVKTIASDTSTITTTLTWPTGFVSYQSGAWWSGKIPGPVTLDKEVSNSKSNFANSTLSEPVFSNSTRKACSTATAAEIVTYPTQLPPVFPTPRTYSILGLDPFPTFDPALWYNWQFFDSINDPYGNANCAGIYDSKVFLDYAAAYPTLPIYEYCSATTNVGCAALALEGVVYLTTTQYRGEAGEQEHSTTSQEFSEETVPTSTAQDTPQSAGVVSGFAPSTTMYGQTRTDSVPPVTAGTIRETQTVGEDSPTTTITGQNEHHAGLAYRILGAPNQGQLSDGTYLIAKSKASDMQGIGTYLVESSWTNGDLVEATYLFESPETARQLSLATYLIASAETNENQNDIKYLISVSGVGVAQEEVSFTMTKSDVAEQPIDSTDSTAELATSGHNGDISTFDGATKPGGGEQDGISSATNAYSGLTAIVQPSDRGDGQSSVNGAASILSTDMTPRIMTVVMVSLLYLIVHV